MTDDKKLPTVNPPQASKVPANVKTAGPKVLDASGKDTPVRPREIGGPKGPEPTRYGDWEVGGRCTDF